MHSKQDMASPQHLLEPARFADACGWLNAALGVMSQR